MTPSAEPTTEGDSSAPPAAEVTIKGPGIQIVRPVDEATLANVIALLFGAMPSPVRNTPLGSGSGGGDDAPSGGGGGNQTWDSDMTLGEFLTAVGASTFPQKICAAGYFLVKIHGAESFDREGIKTALVQAHEDLPGNFSRDFTNAASASLIAQKPGETGKYYVPATGRKAVESHFQDVPKRRARRPRKATANNKGDKGE